MKGECAVCRLVMCACETGITIVQAGGDSRAESLQKAFAYLGRRGWRAELLADRPRRTRTGVIGYHAFDFRFRVTRP
jgi:hypothetical protein